MNDTNEGPGTISVEQIRREARAHQDDGAVTPNYGGDVKTTIDLLNNALAAEIMCVLRYKYHYVTACGIDSDAVRAEFFEHGQQEQEHADRLAKRINQLGGRPEMNPAAITGRSATEYREGDTLVEMITEDLVAERIAIQSYRGWIRFIGDRDPTTRRLLEDILTQEEEHANDLRDLLVSHVGSVTWTSTGAPPIATDVERAEGEGMNQPQHLRGNGGAGR